jgi:selenocysteine lyase/cysteine desulfurase
MIKLVSQNQVHPATTRRSFLKGFAGSAAALSVFPATGSAGALLRAADRLGSADTASEPFWRLVKEQFTIRPGIILLNAANLCPSPHMVRDRVFRLTEDLDGDVSFQNRAKFNALLEESRRKLAAFMGASEDEIAIVRNTSEANNFVVNGLGLKAGDEVVVFDQNHPTNNVAWDVRAARTGFTVKRAGVPQIPNDVEEILKAFRAAITAKTRVLSFTDVSNTTGVRMPSKELCRMARERGVHAHVDGAQTFGALPLNLREMGCDSYSASAHKWFMGPKEAGALFIRQERIAEIWPSVVGVGWGNKVEPAARGARKFETLGQRDDSAVSAMGTTVDFHDLIGRERTEARIRELAAALKEGVSKIPGARLRTSTKAELSAGVCVIGFDGIDHQKVYEALYAKHGVAGAATGGLRFCPHIYNTLEEIDRTVSALRQVVKELG